MQDEQHEPTHVLRFDVPLYLPDPPTATDFDPIEDAFLAIVSISRAAYLRAICGEGAATLIKWPKETAQLHDEPDDLRRAALWVVDNWDAQSTQYLSMKALRKAVGRGDEEGRA